MRTFIRFIDALLAPASAMVKRVTLDLEVSPTPVECIKALRELVDSTGWQLERHEGSRLVDRFAIIMPMAQSARTLGLVVKDGPLRGLELICWSETRGSSGAINIASWLLPGGEEHPLTRNLLLNWVALLPRCPWRWTFGEKSKIGYLLPVWRKSRNKFRKLGLDVKSKQWPIVAQEPWFGSATSEE